MYSYAIKLDKTMYKHQRKINRANVIHLLNVGPPSSPFRNCKGKQQLKVNGGLASKVKLKCERIVDHQNE